MVPRKRNWVVTAKVETDVWHIVRMIKLAKKIGVELKVGIVGLVVIVGCEPIDRGDIHVAESGYVGSGNVEAQLMQSTGTKATGRNRVRRFIIG